MAIPKSKTYKSKTQITRTEVVPFIKVCDDGSYEVCDEAIEFLESLPSPLGIMAMVGPYRTGKSTLLNRCILQEQVFTVGATVRACTKGILLVKKVLQGPLMENGQPMPVIVIDTEGLGSVDATSTHDTRIFSLALLLSSLFIYNSVGSIDENALSNLSLVTNICKLIKLDKNDQEIISESDSSASAAAQYMERANVLKNAEDLGRQAFPPLLWLVRDFSLQLVDAMNNPITPYQYLEQALSPLDNNSNNSGISGNVQDKNDIRTCIRNCFPIRQCITMVRPVNEEHQLQQMAQGINVRVRPLFEEQMSFVRTFVFSNVRAKKIMDIATTGKGIVTYAKSLVQSINEGSHPVIRDAWTLITESQCRDAFDYAKQTYHNLLNDYLNNNDIFDWENIVSKTIDTFKSQPMPSGTKQNKFLQDLKTFLETDKARIDQQALKMSENNIATKLSDIDHFMMSIGQDSCNFQQLALLQSNLSSTISQITEPLLTSSETDFSTRSILGTLDRLNQRSSQWIQILYNYAIQVRNHSTTLETNIRENLHKIEELELMASSVSDQQKDQDKYNEMHQKLTDENSAILQRAVTAEALIEDLEETNAQLKQNIEELNTKFNDMENLYINANETISKIKLKQESMEIQYDVGKSDAVQEVLQSERHKYLAQLETMKLDIENRVSQLNQNFQKQMDEMQQKVIASQNNVLQHEAVRKQLLETLSDLRHDLREVQQVRLNEQLSWSTRIAEAEKSVTSITAQKRRLEDQIDPTLTKRLKTAETECTSLKSELQFKTLEITRLEKESNDARSSARTWEQKYHDARCKHVEEMMRLNTGSLSLGNFDTKFQGITKF